MFETLPLPKLFGAVACVAGGAGIIMLLLTIPIKRLIGDTK